MTTTIVAPGEPTRRAPRSPRRVAVMPAYNEEATVVSVLERLEPLADEIIIVDDGSVDRTRERILAWAESRPNVRLICFNQNRGMSAAYYRAFEEVGRRVGLGVLSPDDVILTVDADGQHEPSEVDDLVARLVDRSLDGVIARRDLSSYTPYKRLGNWLMSLWATLWAGVRLYDVESGYRAFRAGALLSALRYYKGYRYSETVEIAVILPHLSYRIDNNFLVPVPIFRSRTRLKDLAIDIAAIPAAWWRVVTRRTRPAGIPGWLSYALPALGPVVLAALIISVLVHGLFLADDSMQSYSHVWYLSQQLFEHGRLPLHISLLDGGRAVTFPYGIAPYILGSALYQVFGDWSVTLLIAVAGAGTVLAASLARPITRDPWFLLLFVINPFFIDSIESFQFATLWSALFFFLFVWAFERDRYLLAAPLLWLAVSSHPIMGAAAAGVYLVAAVASDRSRLRALVLIVAPVGLALIPVYWMMLDTPAIRENSILNHALSIMDTLPRRGTIFLLPFVFTSLAPMIRRNYRVTLACFAVFLFGGLIFATGAVRFGDLNRGGYSGVFSSSADMYTDFFASPEFKAGATYRVMEPTEREDGMYRFMRQGAVLSHEFFGESQMRRDWSESQYGCYTALKKVDFVVIEKAYDRRYHKNEKALLDSLAGSGEARLAYADAKGRFVVYDVRPFVAGQTSPSSIKECGLS